MARSTYIYIVEYDPPDGLPSMYAAFTVKHELVAHLRRLMRTVARDTYVYRLQDNAPGAPVELNVPALLAAPE